MSFWPLRDDDEPSSLLRVDDSEEEEEAAEGMAGRSGRMRASGASGFSYKGKKARAFPGEGGGCVGVAFNLCPPSPESEKRQKGERGRSSGTFLSP